MSESNDNQDFLALQKEGESTTKTADHTEVSDPNSEGVKVDTDFIENNQSSGDGGEEQKQEETTGGGSDDTEQQQTSSGGGDSEDSGEQKEGGEGEGGEKKKNSSKQENVESIPTAGGERLGQQHWGESKIVPDVPKSEGEKENVSSSEGQPDQETKDNTAKNTGGAESGASEGGDKSLIDKIKDKLPIGGNKE